MRKPRPNTYNPAQALHLDLQRSKRPAAQLPVVLGADRARSDAFARPLRGLKSRFVVEIVDASRDTLLARRKALSGKPLSSSSSPVRSAHFLPDNTADRRTSVYFGVRFLIWWPRRAGWPARSASQLAPVRDEERFHVTHQRHSEVVQRRERALASFRATAAPMYLSTSARSKGPDSNRSPRAIEWSSRSCRARRVRRQLMS